MDFHSPPGYDRTRQAEIGNKNIRLEHLEEAYTTEHWLVRIYRVKKAANRQKIAYSQRKVKTGGFVTKKVDAELFWIFESPTKPLSLFVCFRIHGSVGVPSNRNP